MIDIISASRVYEILLESNVEGSMSPLVQTGVTRLCVFQLALALAKCEEFYRHYKAILPDCVRPAWKSLHADIRARNVKHFRDKVAGHLWDDDRRAPLPTAQVMSSFSDICRGDLSEFLHWCNRPDGNLFPKTVVSILERTRDELPTHHRLAEVDFVDHQWQPPR